MKCIVILFTIALIAGKTKAQSNATKVFFVHVNVVDVVKGEIMPDMSVIISGNKIIAVEPSKTIKVSKTEKIIDCKGKFMIPGLWDMHVHLGNAGADALPLLIANGVTGVRDMGTQNFDTIKKWRNDILTGLKVGPRIKAAGPILDGGTYPEVRVLVNNEKYARRAVDSLASIGVDFIKVHEHLTKEIYYAIADEAKKLKIPFVGHVPTSDTGYLITGLEASNAGQKSLEHMFGLPFYGDKKVDLKELFDVFIKNKTWVTPTLSVYWISANREDSTIRNDQRMKYVSPTLKEWWKSQMVDWSENSKNGRKFMLSARTKMIPLLKNAGIPLLAGTDLGFVFVLPGFGLHDELAYLVTAGLSPAEALRTATINPALYFSQENELGTIVQGKIADLILLEKNPLDDIKNISQISTVVFNGRIFSKPDLDELLNEIEIKEKKNSK